MKIQYYIQLSDRIAWSNKSLVEDILSQNKDLDLLHKNGKFFKMAIESNSTDITEILLEYFANNQLSKYDSKSIEYYNLKKQLIEIIEVAIDEVDLLPEMKEVLSPYIDFEGSEHNTLNDSFSDIDQTTFIQNVDKDAASNNFLNEEVLKKFEAEQNSQTKIIENLLGFGTEEIPPQIEEHTTNINVDLSGDNIQKVH